MMAYGTKGGVSEDDVYALVQRYGASTIFTLLQEISCATEKDVAIDWRTIVKDTSTGISNAREYQMLWRHLAYLDPLEKVEDGVEPLSDESDLEFEIEAAPELCEEVLTEVDCCVKVLLSCGSVGDSGPVVGLNAEVPSTSDTPNDQASGFPPDKQHLSRYHRTTNASALFIQKQPLSTGLSNEGLDGVGSLNAVFPAKKKRKLWTKEEDTELIAAVEKFGEGNWANILKGEFKHDRTASQLSQRWAIIRKRQTNSKQSGGGKASSEEMLAAQKAFSMALNMPMSGSLSTILSGGTQMQTSNSSASTFMAGGASASADEQQPTASQALKQSVHQRINPEISSQKGASNPSNKLRSTTQKKPPAQVKPSICPNPLIQAAAFAAGGRIATPSTAASLFKAAQSKNAVRIRHGVGTSRAGSAAGAIAGSNAANPRYNHPSISLLSSGGAMIQSKKLCQTQAGSAKTSSLPLSPEPNSAAISSCRSLENVKKTRRGGASAASADELLAEEAAVNGKGKCVEDERLLSENLKVEQAGEAKGSDCEVMNPSSDDSKLDGGDKGGAEE